MDALSSLAFVFHCFLVALSPPECCFRAMLISFCALIEFNLHLYSKSHYYLSLCHSSFSLNFPPRWSSVTQMVRISHPDGASSVSSDEGGVGGVSGSHPGPLIRRQAAAHHQVSGLTDRHPGGRPESGNRKSGLQPVPARPLPQGTGVPYHQPAYQGTHLVSESWWSLRWSKGKTYPGNICVTRKWECRGLAPSLPVCGMLTSQAGQIITAVIFFYLLAMNNVSITFS